MVNYFLNYQFAGASDTERITESFRVFESSSTTISIRPSTSPTLRIYSGAQPYQLFDYQPAGESTNSNLSEFTLEYEGVLQPNKNFIKHFSNTHPYIFLSIVNDQASPEGTFLLALQHSNGKPFITSSVRDSNLRTDTLVSLTRPTTDFLIDTIDGNITGFEAVEIKAKGTLSITESLLLNSDVAVPFIEPARVADANTINSDVATDTTGGIGAIQVLVRGLNLSNAKFEYTTTLAGLTNVVNTSKCIFVNSMEVSKVGSMGFNMGNIRVYNGGAVDATKLMCSIEAGESNSFNPQYEPPSNYNLYLTKMSVFGSCLDEGYVKIGKYTYTLDNNPIFSLLDKFNVSPNMNFERNINYTILDGERLVILKKSYGALTTTFNDISISLTGIQKLVNLDIQSNI